MMVLAMFMKISRQYMGSIINHLFGSKEFDRRHEFGLHQVMAGNEIMERQGEVGINWMNLALREKEVSDFYWPNICL